MKRAAVIFILIFCLTLGGCFSYKGLDRLIIVMGIALDYDEENERYLATLEVVDIAKSSKEEGIKSALIECDGVSITDAFFNATRKVKSALYFGSCEVLIICQKIAERGLKTIIDTFMRTKELRETAFFLVSKEEMAADIFKKAQGLSSAIISSDIQQIMEQGSMFSGAIRKVKMYQIYIDILAQNKCLSLPAIGLAENDQEKVVEADGTAVFCHDKQINWMSSDETVFFLLSINEYRGGIITYDRDGDPSTDYAIFVNKASSKTTLKMEGDEPSFGIDIKLRGVLDEAEKSGEQISFDEMKQIEQEYAEMIKGKTDRLIEKLQKEFRCDISGFGRLISKVNPKYWEKIKDTWLDIYPNVKIDVNVSVKITSVNITR